MFVVLTAFYIITHRSTNPARIQSQIFSQFNISNAEAANFHSLIVQ